MRGIPAFGSKSCTFIKNANVGGQARSDEDHLRFQLKPTLCEAATGRFALDAMEERGTDIPERYNTIGTLLNI